MALVLVVDDHAIIRNLVKLNLELVGHDVVTAGDGEEALDVLAREHPDVVVCDLMMPGIGGFTVLRLLRADPATAKIPFVVLTAKTMPEDIQKALDLGADRYITKPFDPQDVTDAVAQLLARE
jgi:CheY-like chemotaxis protein